MDTPLSIADHLLERGRLLVRLGRSADARRFLTRVLSLPELASSARAEAHRQLGHVELGSQRFRRARRHYRAAARLRPYDAELCWHYACAVAADPNGDPDRSRVALRKAVGINPYEPRYWAALGTASLTTGREREAARAFRRAARLRPEDPATLGEVLDGFVALGRRRQAVAALTAARLRAPGDARLRQLGNALYFELARQEQGATCAAAGEARAVLAFPGRTGPRAAEAGLPGVVRVDRRSTPAPHVLRMFGPRRRPRRAQ